MLTQPAETILPKLGQDQFAVISSQPNECVIAHLNTHYTQVKHYHEYDRPYINLWIDIPLN